MQTAFEEIAVHVGNAYEVFCLAACAPSHFLRHHGRSQTSIARLLGSLQKVTTRKHVREETLEPSFQPSDYTQGTTTIERTQTSQLTLKKEVKRPSNTAHSQIFFRNFSLSLTLLLFVFFDPATQG